LGGYISGFDHEGGGAMVIDEGGKRGAVKLAGDEG
jgi:hypothetical protein